MTSRQPTDLEVGETSRLQGLARCHYWGVFVLCLGLWGCPSYKDSRSGTYEQVNASVTSRGDNLRIDFFRYGDNARALFRFFEPDVVANDPFGEEVFCMRTRAARFQSDGDPQFDLSILSDQNLRFIQGGRLFGSFVDADTLEASITHGSETVVDQRRLQQTRSEPSTNCNAITRTYIHPLFTLPNDAPNDLPDGRDYQIDNPVLAIQWVRLSRPGAQFVRTTETSRRWRRLDETHFDRSRNLFRGDAYMWLDPPDPEVRMGDDDRAYALGHVVIIDDRESEGSFTWDRDREPIVATALQRGTRPEAPEAADGSGKAILFVSNKLTDLSDTLRERRFAGLDGMGPDHELADEHFYIIDIDISFRQNEVLTIDFERYLDHPGAREITLKATDRYLGEGPSRFLPLLPPN